MARLTHWMSLNLTRPVPRGVMRRITGTVQYNHCNFCPEWSEVGLVHEQPDYAEVITLCLGHARVLLSQFSNLDHVPEAFRLYVDDEDPVWNIKKVRR